MALAGDALPREMLVYGRHIVQPNALQFTAGRRKNESLIQRGQVAEDRYQKLDW